MPGRMGSIVQSARLSGRCPPPPALRQYLRAGLRAARKTRLRAPESGLHPEGKRASAPCDKVSQLVPLAGPCAILIGHCTSVRTTNATLLMARRMTVLRISPNYQELHS